MKKLLQFIQYHNAVPIAFGILFLGASATFAASPEAREAVLSSREEVRSVDNTYVIAADLESRDFGLRITEVVEDDDNYYVSYTYRTISVIDYVWQEADVSETMRVSRKEILGKDLGLFVARQLGEEIRYHLSFLGEVQEQEREKGVSQKRVATLYSGLVGRFLDSKEETFPGYAPVIEEKPIESGGSASVALAGSGETHIALPPPPDFEAMVAEAVRKALAGEPDLGVASSTASSEGAGGGGQVAGASSSSDSSQGTSTPAGGGTVGEFPVVIIMGDNPALVVVGDSYTDQGALVSDDKDQSLGIATFVDGEFVLSVHLDTSTTTTYEITYRAVDSDDNATEETRIVMVEEPPVEEEPPIEEPPVVEEPAATTTPPVSDPAPEPELDITAPVITIMGPTLITITEGDSYVDEGATATDDVDGDITSSIIVGNPIDTTTPGSYQVTYNISDVAGNQAIEVVRDVVVETLPEPAPPEPEPTPEPTPEP